MTLTSQGNLDPTVSPSRRLRVLIADDDRDTVMNLGILLRSEGIEVQLARGRAQVPRAVAQFEPDVIFIGLAMSDHDGLEIAQTLTRYYGESCPVLIALAARSNEADREKAAASGFKHYIAKPYDPEALLKLVLSVTPR
jgi:CheY-like chemotaxis protein